MEPIKLIAQLGRMSLDKDGGGKITLEFGSESSSAFKQLVDLHAKGEISLACAFIPYGDGGSDWPDLG